MHVVLVARVRGAPAGVFLERYDNPRPGMRLELELKYRERPEVIVAEFRAVNLEAIVDGFWELGGRPVECKGCAGGLLLAVNHTCIGGCKS